MSLWLKQSTSATVKIGPFLDSTDGVTPETGLAISQADVRLSKNGGNMAQKNDAAAATHDEIGWYDCDLDATDTGTLGRLVLMVNESGALPVWHQYQVVEADAFDAFYAAAGTGHVESDTVQVSGSAAAANNMETAYTGGAYNVGGGSIVAASVTGAVGSVTGAVGSVTGNVGGNVVGTVASVVGNVGGNVVGDVQGNVDGSVASVTGNVGGNVVGSVASVVAQVSANITAISGDGPAADNLELDYDGTGYAKANSTIGTTTTNTDMRGTDNAALAATSLTNVTWTNARAGYLDNLNVGGNVASSAEIAALNDPSAADTADAVWDEARAGHVGAGTFGQGVASVQGNVTGSVASVTGNVGGNVVGSVASVTGAVGSVTGNVGGNVTGSVGSLAAQAQTDVNDQVLDVLTVDTFAEPGQEAPAATNTLAVKIAYIFKKLRNKKEQTAAAFSLYNDAGLVVDQKATVSDDGVTTTFGELVSGP